MCTKSPRGYFWRRLRETAQEFSLSEVDLQIASVAICLKNNGYRNNEERIVKLLTLDKELANFAKKNGIESPNLFFKKK